MTNEKFEALVAKLDARAKQNPSAYRLRVTLLALLGNIYLAVVLAILIAIFAASIASAFFLKAAALKFVFVVGAFLSVVLKALWVTISPPRGFEVSRHQAGDLFAMIDALRRQLDAPRFHHVLITDDFNAGVVQLPRFGIFGGQRNYLLIGLPLMKSLSVEQLKAVLAHEFGHLAKGHGRTSNWIYRQRLRWSRLMAALDAHRSRGSFLFRRFLDWYAPYFNAYSFPLARANEYEADATSARLTSPRAAAEALTGVSVVGNYLAEQYWPQIHKMADDIPQPRFAPFSSLNEHVATDLNTNSAKSWLDQAMARTTSLADTHPALGDRLKAIGESPRLAPPEPGQSADRLLGELLGPLTERFDQRWQENIAPSWEKRFSDVLQSRRRLAELQSRYESGEELSIADAYERAVLTDSLGGDGEDAIAQLRELHSREPINAQVAFALGARLIARDDDNGCALIEEAMRGDKEAIIGGAEILREYHSRNGRQEQANAWHKRLVERQRLIELAKLERSEVRVTDQFDDPCLPNPQVQELSKKLQRIPGLRRAYFLRRGVKYMPQYPQFVLGFSATAFYQMHSARRDREVARRIRETVEFPGETIIINIAGKNYRFGRKLRKMRWARVV